jgi:hypothetical protein
MHRLDRKSPAEYEADYDATRDGQPAADTLPRVHRPGTLQAERSSLAVRRLGSACETALRALAGPGAFVVVVCPVWCARLLVRFDDHELADHAPVLVVEDVTVEHDGYDGRSRSAGAARHPDDVPAPLREVVVPVRDRTAARLAGVELLRGRPDEDGDVAG